jgi:hypothetical protein
MNKRYQSKFCPSQVVTYRTFSRRSTTAIAALWSTSHHGQQRGPSPGHRLSSGVSSSVTTAFFATRTSKSDFAAFLKDLFHF